VCEGNGEGGEGQKGRNAARKTAKERREGVTGTDTCLSIQAFSVFFLGCCGVEIRTA